jgi:hypothetical protein
MAEMHTVEPGESLATIAKRYHLQSWQTLWDHPKNAELRSKRPKPELIHVGDLVYIPDREKKDVPGATTKTHDFVAKVAKTEEKLRSITILVHGVNTDAAWFKLVDTEMKKYQDVIEVPGGGGNIEYKLKYLIIPFSWGDYENQKQGGYFNYAVDEVHQMFENPWVGYDRIYQGHSAVRLKELIDECNKLGVQVNVIAHSNGTLETCGAMLLGCSIDNFIMMGSPLDCDNEKSQAELKSATANVRSKVINFWSPGDKVAGLKGGIGRFGENAYFRKQNGHIGLVKFDEDEVIRTVKIKASIGHSDYMLAEHMPIFSSYIREFAEASSKRVPYDKAKVDALLHAADWRNQAFYVKKKNVTLKSPEMKKYDAQIKEITK